MINQPMGYYDRTKSATYNRMTDFENFSNRAIVAPQINRVDYNDAVVKILIIRFKYMIKDWLIIKMVNGRFHLLYLEEQEDLIQINGLDLILLIPEPFGDLVCMVLTLMLLNMIVT